MTQFPSSIIGFSTKANGQIIDAGDVNSPQNEITALETKVGVDGSAVTTTLDYIAKNAASNGGGHVQVANVGGTGQTSFNKGDLLIATSSSVLAKLAVGTDGFAIVADSTQAAGIKYAAIATAANIQNQTNTYARASVVSTSVLGVILQTPISVFTDGLGLQIKFPVTNTTSIQALSFPFGLSSITARIKNTDGTNPIVGAIQASMIGIVEFDSVSSVFQLQNTYLPTYGTDITKFLRNDATWVSAGGGLYKTGNTTHTMNSTTSTVIAHGLGTTPKYIRLTVNKDSSTGNTGAQVISTGTYDGSTQISTWTGFDSNSNTTRSGQDTRAVTFQFGASGGNVDFLLGVASFDATNITIAWTTANSPAPAAGNIMWEAYA